MGKYWDTWVERIINERNSPNPSKRRRGFLRQLVTELAVYATIGVFIFIGGYIFDIFTALVIFSNPYYEAPIVVAATTGVLFQTAWDNWLRGVETLSENANENKGAEKESSESVILEDDTVSSR